MDSDAIFDEESEYRIGFKIRATNNAVLLIFRWKNQFFFRKKPKIDVIFK
jgi:hypothetical protein